MKMRTTVVRRMRLLPRMRMRMRSRIGMGMGMKMPPPAPGAAAKVLTPRHKLLLRIPSSAFIAGVPEGFTQPPRRASSSAKPSPLPNPWANAPGRGLLWGASTEDADATLLDDATPAPAPPTVASTAPPVASSAEAPNDGSRRRLAAVSFEEAAEVKEEAAPRGGRVAGGIDSGLVRMRIVVTI